MRLMKGSSIRVHSKRLAANKKDQDTNNPIKDHLLSEEYETNEVRRRKIKVG